MKPITFALFCAWMVNFHQSSAQSNLGLKHEIYGGWGAGSVPQIGITLGSIIGNALGNAIINGIVTELGGTGVTYEEKITGTGAISVGYNYYVSPRWSVGCQGVFERVSDRLEFSNGNVGTYRSDVLTGMVRTDFRWVNKPGFKFYSGAAVGGSNLRHYEVGDPTNENSELMLAWQATPLGLRFGKNIGIYLEAGLGWDGLIKGGISARF